MKVSILYLIFCTLLLAILAYGRTKKKDSSPSSKAPPKPAVKLNVDILPPLQDVLAELDMTSYLRHFVKMGVTETRLLLKLSSMDFQIMSMDWGEGFGKDAVARLKEKIAQLYELATVPQETTRPELEERKKLVYGRLYLPHGVQAMEYAQGSFGGPPPVGAVALRLSNTTLECDAVEGLDYGGDFVLARRGNCTFLQKALLAKAHNAAGLIIANTEDSLDHPSSGLGVDKNITEAAVASLGAFTVLGMSNQSWAPLTAALRFVDHRLPVHIVPIKCQTGGKCQPLLEEERALLAEVSWGRLRVRKTDRQVRSFEFLSSNFGAPLPVESSLRVVRADPIDACSPLLNIIPEGKDYVALVVHRGSCRFDVKAMHGQEAGARMIIVVDVEDEPLQRLGALAPAVGYLEVPNVLVTAEAGRFLESSAEGSTVEVLPGSDSSGFERWLEIAYTTWSEDPEERVMQLQGLVQKFQETENHDIVSWLQRRIQEIDHEAKKSIDTDEL